MFNLEVINIERDKFINCTHLNIPLISNVIHEGNDQDSTFTFIAPEEIWQDNYSIHICEKLYDTPIKYQYACIWHEFTHISDCISYKHKSNYLNILDTFSEAHAQAIELRYSFKMYKKICKVSIDNEIVITPKGERSVKIWINECIIDSKMLLSTFIISKDISRLKKAIYFFCHYCGYLSLLTRKNANKLLEEILLLYPPIYQANFKNLAYSILDKDGCKCAEIYNSILTNAEPN